MNTCDVSTHVNNYFNDPHFGRRRRASTTSLNLLLCFIAPHFQGGVRRESKQELRPIRRYQHVPGCIENAACVKEGTCGFVSVGTLTVLQVKPDDN
jgi:hypothetical protein